MIAFDLRELVERIRLRDLVDEAALRQNVEEIGLVGAHRLYVLVLRAAGVTGPARDSTATACDGGIDDRGTCHRTDERHLARRGRPPRCIETDGERILALRPDRVPALSGGRSAPCCARPWAAAVSLTDRDARPGVVAQAEALTTRAARRGGREVSCAPTGDRAGRHRRWSAFTARPFCTGRRIGSRSRSADGAALAKRLGIPVACTIFAAPTSPRAGRARRWCRCFIAPSRDRRPAASRSRCSTSAALPTSPIVDGGPDPIAGDTGPGNALIDDFMRARTGAPYDDNGDAAARARWMSFHRPRARRTRSSMLPPPKSLDRNAFLAFAQIWIAGIFGGGRSGDALGVDCRGGGPRAAASAGAAACLDRRRGGGAHRHADENAGQRRCRPATVETADAAGFSADALEAQAFAFLAVRSMRGLPITFPTTSGAPKPMQGGGFGFAG